MTYTKNLNELSSKDVLIAGGKGSSLGEMINNGIQVPDGFIILSSAFDIFLEEVKKDIESILSKINYNEPIEIENASKKIQELLMLNNIPSDITSESKEKFKKLGSKFVAVRSSATSEDGTDSAWAGQLDSFLNTTEETLIHNIKLCFISLFTPRAIFYRFENNLQKSNISVAVVVQRMVNSEKSGVAFSVHPVTEERNKIIVEACYGLGEALVSGQITPSTFVINKSDRSVLDKKMEKQTKAIYRKEDGGNEWRNLNENKYEIPVLSEEEIKELTDIIVKIENHFNFPCDVEWAKEGDKFYIIQSRPITTLSDDIFTRKFKKFFTRELSLIFIEYWHKGEYTELQKLLDGATHFNPLFIRRNGLVDVYYDMNNVDTALQPLFDFFKDNPKKFDEFVIKFNSLQNEMHLMVTDFKFELFEKLFITICKAWGYLPVWVQLGSSSEKYFPRHYIEKSLELRDKFQEIEYTVGEVLKGAIEKKYPELSNYSDVISFKEVIDNKFPDRQELEVRKGEFVYFEGKVLTNTSVQEFGKEYNVEFDESLSTIGEIPKTSSVKTIDSSLIKGQTAYSNGSIIKGVVGEDVLVTHMTRPDMIDKIKKSRAVITDEGGILSHAAITCRELKIPCIIGTKHATKLLKQGDMVEINTEEGVVKLVKDTV